MVEGTAECAEGIGFIYTALAGASQLRERCASGRCLSVHPQMLRIAATLLLMAASVLVGCGDAETTVTAQEQPGSRPAAHRTITEQRKKARAPAEMPTASMKAKKKPASSSGPSTPPQTVRDRASSEISNSPSDKMTDEEACSRDSPRCASPPPIQTNPASPDKQDLGSGESQPSVPSHCHSADCEAIRNEDG